MANNYISDLTTLEAIQRIWEKGIIVDGYNASLYRRFLPEHGFPVKLMEIPTIFWDGK